MNNLNVSNYQIKTSRSGEPVPVINEIHLHSAYDPIKEAKGLAQTNSDVLKKNSKILILGLGFGYHITEIINALNEYHKYFQVIVIEPNSQVFIDCKHYNPIISENVIIYNENNIENLYQNIDLVDFLSDRPGVIAHPASFNLNDSFFRTFLTYKADQKISAIYHNLQNNDLVEFFHDKNPELTLDECIENYITEKNHITSQLDHLIFAYKELVTSTHKNNTGAI